MIDLDRIAQGLHHTFPDLNLIAPLRLLGSGFSSLAVETADGIVFRVARDAAAGARYAKESINLPRLPSHLSVAIPEPYWYAPSSRDFPHGVIGYRKLPGNSLALDDLRTMDDARTIADQIGHIIYDLQQTPHDAVRLDDDFASRQALWAAQREVTLPALLNALQPDEYQLVVRWWDEFLADERLAAYPPVVQHGDLWYGNLLVDDLRITSLLDFEQLSIGDPAQDFVPQLYLGDSFLKLVLDAYQQAGGALDPDFHHRLRQLFAVREFSGLQWSLERDDSEELADSIMKIHRGPILHPSGLDGWRRTW